jgi:hypothetical protein
MIGEVFSYENKEGKKITLEPDFHLPLAQHKKDIVAILQPAI